MTILLLAAIGYLAWTLWRMFSYVERQGWEAILHETREWGALETFGFVAIVVAVLLDVWLG